jgi:nucleoid DNA-binding protein
MKKSDLAKRLAKQAGVSKAQAADQLDHVVSQIISNLKKGEGTSTARVGKIHTWIEMGVYIRPQRRQGHLA